MKNSAMKRIIAVLLCLVVFAGSELTGLTNIVGNLAATDTVDTAETDYDEATEELNLSEEEPADEGTTEEAPEDVTPPSEDTGETAPEEIPAETPAEPSETPADSAGAPAETPGDAAVTEDGNGEEGTPSEKESDGSASEGNEENSAEEVTAEGEANGEGIVGDGNGDEIAPAEIDVYNYESNDVNVRVTLTDPADLPDDAELVVTPVTLSAEAEEKIEEEALKEEKAVENIIAYDIKFMVDDEEVQPGATVKVYVSLPEIEAGQDATVFHVDENDEVENVGGEVNEEGDVVFEAPHFSTYVIVQQGDSQVEVTIEHYNNVTGEKVYADDILKLPIGGRINDYRKPVNWAVSKVVAVTGDKEEEYADESGYGKIAVKADTTVKVYYTPETDTVEGEVTFYDYTVKAGQNGNTYYSINMDSSYPAGTTGTKLTVGEGKRQYEVYKNDFNENKWTGKPAAGQKPTVITGLLLGLDEDGNAIFKYPEPGFFVNEDKSVTVGTGNNLRYLRKVYNDYKLQFERVGDSYTLQAAKKENKVYTAGADFFPLDNEDYYEEEVSNTLPSQGPHNYYFGMRYDVTFTVGDYIGPLEYSFTGDDDLWVVLDGKHVVIDLGGIHDAATDTVDLWDYIGTKGELTDEQKKQEHKLTILYMDRGAGQSNCSMSFVLPNAHITEVTDSPKTNLLLHKENSKGEALAGARFTLTNDATRERFTKESLEDGTFEFTGLSAGTYTLTETMAPSGYIPSVNSWKVRVTLDEDGKTAVANLYLIDGETEAKVDPDANGVYKILNMTEEERIESSMEYNKTAVVKDWNERTYDINITAASKLTSTTTQEKTSTADIMMVFDISRSMNFALNSTNDMNAKWESLGRYVNVKSSLDTTKIYYYGNNTGSDGGNTWVNNEGKYLNRPMIYLNEAWQYYTGSSWSQVPNDSKTYIYQLPSRLTSLKEAATTFVTSTAAASPDSKIGIATFDLYGELKREIGKVGSSPDELVKQINQIFVYGNSRGGTAPGEGLNLASEQLATSKTTDIPQYVILFTDGAPSDGYTLAAETAAASLKENNIVVYSVGLGLTTETTDWLEANIASEGCAFSTNTAEGLGNIFKKIQQSITKSLEIKNATVKDVIDPRFNIMNGNVEITPDTIGTNGNRLSEGDTITLDDGNSKRIIGYDTENKALYVIWNEQTIPNRDKGQWSKTITVKAKDDFIGGNAVPTNISPDSKITTGYGDATLPQPTVNVKMDLTVGNNGVTVFKGDAVPTEEEIRNALFQASDVENYHKYTVDEDGKVHYVVDENENPLSFTPDDFELTWYTDEQCTQTITWDEMKSVIPDETTYYYLEVTYDAGKATSDSNKNTTLNGTVHKVGDENGIYSALNRDQENYPNAEYGVYKIDIVPGRIEITKMLSTPAENDLEFVFQVTGDEGFNKTVKVSIPEGESSGTYGVVEEGSGDPSVDSQSELKNLPRGTYTVTEKAVTGYSIKETNTEGTNCYSSETNNAITFIIGQDEYGNDVITHVYQGGTNGEMISDKFEYAMSTGGILGKVAFTNEKVVADENWNIRKRSSSSDTSGTEIYLRGAEFTLSGNNGQTYYGKSASSEDNKGTVIWYSDSNYTTEQDIGLVSGEYTLRETHAPEGYRLSMVQWTLNLSNGKLVSIEADGEDISSEGVTVGDTMYFYFNNDTLYSLPESGGIGIHWYMVSGTLLMIAGILILYKRKNAGRC